MAHEQLFSSCISPFLLGRVPLGQTFFEHVGAHDIWPFSLHLHVLEQLLKLNVSPALYFSPFSFLKHRTGNRKYDYDISRDARYRSNKRSLDFLCASLLYYYIIILLLYYPHFAPKNYGLIKVISKTRTERYLFCANLHKDIKSDKWQHLAVKTATILGRDWFSPVRFEDKSCS